MLHSYEVFMTWTATSSSIQLTSKACYIGRQNPTSILHWLLTQPQTFNMCNRNVSWNVRPRKQRRLDDNKKGPQNYLDLRSPDHEQIGRWHCRTSGSHELWVPLLLVLSHCRDSHDSPKLRTRPQCSFTQVLMSSQQCI
jgi:hypothetical protein